MNARKHGILSQEVVIPGVERQDDWDAHLHGVLESLGPVGYLESAFVERIAQLMWRLGRVTRYETGAITRDLTDIEYDTPEAWTLDGGPPRHPASVRDTRKVMVKVLDVLDALMDLDDDDVVDSRVGDRILRLVCAALGNRGDLPAAWLDRPRAAPWIAAEIRSVVATLASDHAQAFEAALALTLPAAQEALRRAEAEVAALDQHLAEISRQRLIPNDTDLAKIARYEAHLGRELNRTLAQLELLQRTRSRRPSEDAFEVIDIAEAG